MKFLCGTYFKSQCKFQLTHYKNARIPEFLYKENQAVSNNYVFCRPEHIASLSNSLTFKKLELPDSINLVTHNSDINFGENEIKFVLKLLPNIKHWYTQNLLISHPQVSPIPIGIANPKWSHGSPARFANIIEENNVKDNLYYINFNVSTNPVARIACYDELGIHNFPRYPNAASIKDHDQFVESTQENYLRDISKSYFTVSPQGNGMDCHKTWEALYMKTIPIVTRWHGAEKFKELGIPFIIIDHWSEFKNLKLNKELYDEMWQDFDAAKLDFSFFKQNG